MLEKQFTKDGSKIFQIWPLITNLGISAENNSLLQQNIDLVYVFGGDGTLLNLLRELYVYYKSNSIPLIAAFNLGSLGYLCNFNVEEFKEVID